MAQSLILNLIPGHHQFGEDGGALHPASVSSILITYLEVVGNNRSHDPTHILLPSVQFSCNLNPFQNTSSTDFSILANEGLGQHNADSGRAVLLPTAHLAH